MPLLPNQTQKNVLGYREKDAEFDLLLPASTVGVGPWIQVASHHYKGIHVKASGDIAGLVLNIEISNYGGDDAVPSVNPAAAGISGSKFVQIEDSCTYMRGNITAITGGKVSAKGRAVLES